MHEIELPGLDGSNLLAFLAALGTLRVLTLADPEATVKISWRDRGFWMPVLHHSRIATEGELVEALAKRVCGEATCPTFTAVDLKEDRDLLRSHLEKTCEDRQMLDECVAIATEFIPAKENRPTPSLLNAIGIPKAGKPASGFVGYVKQICHETTREHLHRAIAGPWSYKDPSPMMRWDPNEFRVHALRAKDPAPDQGQVCEKGANRLAIEALSLFPVFPVRRTARTVAFDLKGEVVSWPIWMPPVELDSAKALVASSLPDQLAGRQIGQVFESRRIWGNNYYLNFLPSRPLL